jgi:hypothetical protein
VTDLGHITGFDFVFEGTMTYVVKGNVYILSSLRKIQHDATMYQNFYYFVFI